MREARAEAISERPLPERFDALIGSLMASDPCMLPWALDRDLVVTYTSATTAAALAQTTPEAVIGRPLAEIAPEPVVLRMARMVERAGSEGGWVVGSAVWRGRRVRSSYLALRDGQQLTGETLIVTRPAPLAMDEQGQVDVDEATYADLGELSMLTRRELEVLAYLGQGLTLTQIGDELHRSVKTVKRFREEISKKLGEGDRCRLGQLARDHGLLPHHASLDRLNFSPPQPTPRGMG